MQIIKNKRSFNNFFLGIFFLIILAVFINIIQIELIQISGIDVPKNVLTLDEFRKIEISKGNLEKIQNYGKEENCDKYRIITMAMLDNDFSLNGISLNKDDILKYIKKVLKVKDTNEEFNVLANIYQTLFKECKVFPVAKITTDKKATVTFENSWMLERTYGGARGHEGTDIMADINKRGYYPIVSMTDGTVENKGWLELGGYRLGISSESGIYYYYAHMSDYADNIEEGTKIKAGQLLGFMGDTGYSKVEGTTGNFDVHLHMGIYLTDNNSGEEISINPYYILKYIDKVQ